MNKDIVILIAQVKYPSSDNTYLTAISLASGYPKRVEEFWDDYKTKIETDGFKIVNNLFYVVPSNQVEEASK